MTPKTTLFLASLMLLISTSMGAGFETLSHHWNFDEGPDWHDDPFQTVATATVVKDAVGTADATLQNMDGTAFVSGRQYTGLEFDGTDDSLLSAADVAPVLGGTASLSFWIKTTQTGAAAAASAPGVMGSSGIQWGWIDDAGRVVLSVDGTVVVRSVNALNDGTWHHVIFTRDSSTGAAQVFVDGSLSASATGPTGVRSASITRIAHMQNGSGALFQGRLDQIHAFSGVVDVVTVQALNDNHAPKTWVVNCDGETSAPFNTDSVLVSTYAYDAEQDTLSVASFTQPIHGSVTLNGDGSFAYTATGGYTGSDAFTAMITDGRGGYTENTINVLVTAATAPGSANRTTTFENFQVIQAGGSAIGLSGWRVPRAIDWDNDGDQDLLVGDDTGIWRYANTGTPSAPVFAAGVRVQANGSNISLSGNILIALADMTGDGVDDLVAVAGDRTIRIYRNTSAAGAVPVYAAAVQAPSSSGGNFVLPDQRFDAADWDGDGLVDLVMGNWSGEVRAYRNVGTAAAALFDPSDYEVLDSGSYNLYPRVFDINLNGIREYIRGVNWGSITFWFDPASSGLGGSDGGLTITDTGGATPNLHSLTDGAMVDFADFNGDEVLDMLVGGHAGSSTYIAYGVANTVADSLAAIEAIYDAYPTGLGAALSDTNNSPTLLEEVRAAEANIIMHMQAATLSEREAMFAQMVAHVGSYSFLQMGSALDTVEYNHVPSIAGQNLMTMHEMLPDTAGHRINVANAVGLTGTHREIYLQMGLHVGDNQQATQGQIESVRDFMLLQPRESFPDAMITLDHYYGDGRGGHVNSFRGAKNTFNWGEGNNSSEWAGDLNAAAEAFYGYPAQRGDYFTFVMGHEVTHSLDGYVNGRANDDLWRRKGQWLTLAAGPDVLSANSDNNDFWNWDVTKARFQAQGHWDGVSDWNTAWDAYWATGPGSVFKVESVMRIDVKFFLGAPQEAMATQANHHWAHAEARLIGAIDRYQRGVAQGIEPMKANITEVLTFLDWISCGMNKIVMQDTEGVSTPYPRADYSNTTHAWVERNDKGYITQVVTTGGSTFNFELDAYGIVTNLVAGVAQDPSPADGATNVESDLLGWTKEPSATGYDIYVGTSQAAVANATKASPEYLGSTSVAAFTPDLFDVTQYYWRIDTTNSSMTVKGPVWSFSTGYIPVTASTISVNFIRNGGETFAGGQTIGPLETDSANWNEGTGQSGSLNNLVNELGVATDADVTWQSATLWSNSDGTGDDEHRMATGYLDDGDIGGGKGATVTLSNITFSVYRVYGLFASDQNGSGSSGIVNVNVNGTWALGGSAATTASAWGSIGANNTANGEYWTEIGSGALRANYWTVVTTGSTCTIVSEDRNGENRGCITAVIIEELPDTDGDGIPDETDPDDDNDGMPDAWELANSLNPRLDDRAGNPDGDGYDNWTEYVADTLAQDGGSFQTFSIELAPGTGEPTVRFHTSGIRNYAIEYRDDLTSGSWQDLGSVFSGTGSEMTIPDPTSETNRFYRLRIQLP